jgi:hypothetical protein
VPAGAPGGAATLTYNALGERTSRSAGPPTTYGWNQAGRLASVDSNTYAYDATGLRVRSVTGSGTKTFAWDRSARLPLLLYDGQTSYVYAPRASR